MTKSLNLSRLAIHATLLLAAALYLVPLVVMLLTSFKTPDDIRTGNLLSWPDVFTVIGWSMGRATQVFLGHVQEFESIVGSLLLAAVLIGYVVLRRRNVERKTMAALDDRPRPSRG